MKEKVDLALKDLLTLIGPAQIVRIMEEEDEGPVFEGNAVLLRDYKELTEQKVRFIQPTPPQVLGGRYALEIWVYAA